MKKYFIFFPLIACCNGIDGTNNMMKSGENDETSKADFMNTYKVNPCIDRILGILDEMEEDYPAQVNVLKN